MEYNITNCIFSKYTIGHCCFLNHRIMFYSISNTFMSNIQLKTLLFGLSVYILYIVSILAGRKNKFSGRDLN